MNALVNHKAMSAAVMQAAIETLGIEPPKQATVQAQERALSVHFAKNTPKKELSGCSSCGGVSDIKLAACPYCGDREIIESETPAEASAAVGASELSPPPPTVAAEPPPRSPTPVFDVGWPGLCERLEAVDLGTRWSTGLAALDELFRGGLPEGKLLVIGGAPGAGKTTLADQIARGLAAQDLVVVVLEPDDAGGFDTRWLMSSGLSREQAELRTTWTLARAAELQRLPVKVAPSHVTLNEAAAVMAKLAQHHPGRQLVLVVDSLQKAAKNLDEPDGETRRDRVDEALELIKGTVDEHRAIAVVTSELARAGYSQKQDFRNVRGLGAFKESGGIEYAADVAIVLHKAGDAVEAEVCKNRLGREGLLTLRLDRGRASFSVADFVEEEPATIDARVLEIIRQNPELAGKALLPLVGAGREAMYDAIDRLKAAGKVVNAGTLKRPKLVAVDNGPNGPERSGWSGGPQSAKNGPTVPHLGVGTVRADRTNEEKKPANGPGTAKTKGVE